MSDFEEQLQKIQDKSGEGKSEIAIIDDDPTFSFMLKDYLLSSAHLKSDVYKSGEDFLKDFRKGDERIIILDYNFETGLDGPEILSKIKYISPTTKVIIVSAQDDLEKAIDMLRNGAADYFLKTNNTVFANIHSSLLKIIEMEKNRWN